MPFNKKAGEKHDFSWGVLRIRSRRSGFFSVALN